MPNKDELLSKIEMVHRQLTELRQQYWSHYDLFSAQWWLLLALFIVPWLVWWRLVDRTRLKDIVWFGIATSYLIFFLDHVGYELNLWIYPHKLFRFIPESSAYDLGVLPVLHMLVYQYCRSWRSFLMTNTIMAVIFVAVCEPVSVWLGLYKLIHWKYIYSFPLYILKVALIKWLLEAVTRKQDSHTSAQQNKRSTPR